jgi:hypothetical protein
MHGEYDWYVTKEGWKEHFKKWFPENKDMTEKQLKKERKSFAIIGYIWIFLALFVAFLMFMGPQNPTVLQRVSFTSLVVGLLGACLAMYAQYRVLEAEINFELRLREAIASIKAES